MTDDIVKEQEECSDDDNSSDDEEEEVKAPAEPAAKTAKVIPAANMRKKPKDTKLGWLVVLFIFWLFGTGGYISGLGLVLGKWHKIPVPNPHTAGDGQAQGQARWCAQLLQSQGNHCQTNPDVF